MEEKSVEEVTPHPLENLVVLEVLFQCDMGVGSLKRNRLVCKRWLRVSGKRWEETEKYPILDYYSEPCSPDNSGENGMSLVEFHDQFQAGVSHVVQMVTSPRPQGKLTLCRWMHLKDEMSRIDHWFRTSPMFQWVKRLTFSNCRFLEEVWVFQEPFLKEVAQLEELTLKDCVVEEEALEALRVANQHWMQHPGRANWLQARRDVQRPRHFTNWRLISTNVPYYPEGYQHQKLTSLTVSLGQVEGQRAIRFWGPLLAKLPNLSSLKVRGYVEPGAEAGELPPLELPPPGWDTDAVLQRLPQQIRYSPEYLAELARMRSCWLGMEEESIGLPPPTQRGYFWELFWFHEIGQVVNTLRQLDLLDFSQRAQDYGVFSTVEIASTEKDAFGQGIVYRFPWLTSLAFDLGLDPLFAERDLITLYRWIQMSLGLVKELVLYRAPFATQFPRTFSVLLKVKRLELWGNVSNSLDFLTYWSSVPSEFSWNTTCYEDKWMGRRIHHLLRGEGGRRANPLNRTDLVEATDWETILNSPDHAGFGDLTSWEMDWTMKVASWRKLAAVVPNLRRLKGLIVGDEQLVEVVGLWPGLEEMEMQHGSRVTMGALGKCLGNLDNLKKFKWRGCPCTQELFGGEEGMAKNKEIFWGEVDKDKIEMELPWDVRASQNSNGEKGCIQATFESALLTGNSEEFFKILETHL